MVSSGREERQGHSAGRLSAAWAGACACAALLLLHSPLLAETRWDMPLSSSGPSVPARQLRSFADLVATRSGNELQINVHEPGKLLPPAEIKDAVRKGVVPVGEITLALHAGEAPIYGFDTLPFLAMTYPDARRLYALQKPLLDKRLADEGLVLLASLPFQPLGLCARKPLTAVGDFSGLRLRAYNSLTRLLAQRSGGLPVAVDTAELAQAVRGGRIDAFTASATQAVARKAGGYAPFFHRLGAWIPRNALIINKASYDALTAEERKALTEAAAQVEAQGWAQAEAEATQLEERLGGSGFAVVSPTVEFTAGLRRIGQAIALEWVKDMGEDGVTLLDRFARP